MNDSPAVLLYDAAGNPVVVKDADTITPASQSVLLVAGVDGTTARTQRVDSSGRSKVQADALPLPAGAATEATAATIDAKLATIDAVLDSIKDVDGIKKITDPVALGASSAEIGSVKITDGVDTALVSSDGRLLVDALSSSPIGSVYAYLLNGTSSEMAIDADPTPVEFIWEPDAVEIEGLSLSLILEDATIYFGDKYAGISALSNGVLIEAKAQDVVYSIANIQRTRELFQLALPGGFEVYAATPDCARAEITLVGLHFAPTGTYATDDYVKITIRDDIDGLSHQSALFKGRVATS